jgi:GTP pyrophosphokinase
MSTVGEAGRTGVLGERFDAAVAFAGEAHRHQVRKGTSTPYVSHLLGVASLVLEYGGTEQQAIAGLLHDCVEDCGTEYKEPIRQEFGDAMLAIVLGCSDADVPRGQRKPEWKQRKDAYLDDLRSLRRGDPVLLVSACDKLHNLRTMVSDLRSDGPRFWRRFNRGAADQLWYQTELTKVFSASLGGRVTDDLIGALQELQELDSEPDWWNPNGRRYGGHGLGVVDDGFLRQSDAEARRWARRRGIVPSAAGLSSLEREHIESYSNGEDYRKINENFYQQRETLVNASIRAALGRTRIPDGVIVWRGAGFKLFRYPVRGARLFTDNPTKATGRVFDHRPPISTSVGNSAAAQGLNQLVHYKLRVEPGARGLFIPEIAFKGYEEQELLLAPGSLVRVDEVHRGRSRWYVNATVLTAD